MRTPIIKTTVALAALLVSSACEEPAPLPEASPAVEAKAVAGPAAPQAAELPKPFITHKTADPDRMPNDSIHAPLGRQKASRPLPAGHPPLAGHQQKPGPAKPASPGMVPRGGATEQGVAMPLPLKGPGSAAELAGRPDRSRPAPAARPFLKSEETEPRKAYVERNHCL